MNSRIPAALAVIVALLAALPVCAETYTVDGARGDDAHDGITAPFATIARGVKAVGPGDTLRIVPMDEPYPESLRLNRHGLRGAPITIEGGGATLTGADPAPTEGWTEHDGIWQVPLQAHDRMMVFGADRHFIKGAGPANLEPEQWRWADGVFYFRPADGKTPADYDLRLAVNRASGVLTSGAGLIIVRDLKCVNFWNDGFNLHGGTGPIWFENIVGNWNGDEGFSAHENTEAYVRGGEFSNNYWHGINDIIYSRTHFVDVVCRDNRSKGVRFNGGMHSLTDCEVSGSPINVELLHYSQTKFPAAESHPLTVSLTNLRNVVVRSDDDEVGVFVGPDSEAVIEHCLLQGGAPVIDVQAQGNTFVVNSVVTGGANPQIVSAGDFVADHNLYSPATFTIGGANYGADAFADYRAATGNDANSIVREPVLAENGMHLAPASPGYRGADSGAYGGYAIGPEDRSAAPAAGSAGVTIVEGDVVESEDGATRVAYDFEEANPWSRVYPVPEQSADGIAVEWTAELSDEQAHSGARSAKVTVTTPAVEPRRYNIKLFSQYLPFEQPIRKVSYWLYGDASGRSARLRVRDGSHESFYGPAVTIDWEGWRQVTWDLEDTPPINISGGNEDKLQDGPTMELVVEISQRAGTEMTLFLDDLVVELAPPKPRE
ncbi:MAG: right-handed parallel beta-helix repeat-containing protein [Armatimonadota bacterium]